MSEFICLVIIFILIRPITEVLYHLCKLFTSHLSNRDINQVSETMVEMSETEIMKNFTMGNRSHFVYEHDLTTLMSISGIQYTPAKGRLLYSPMLVLPSITDYSFKIDGNNEIDKHNHLKEFLHIHDTIMRTPNYIRLVDDALRGEYSG